MTIIAITIAVCIIVVGISWAIAKRQHSQFKDAALEIMAKAKGYTMTDEEAKMYEQMERELSLELDEAQAEMEMQGIRDTYQMDLHELNMKRGSVAWLLDQLGWTVKDLHPQALHWDCIKDTLTVLHREFDKVVAEREAYVMDAHLEAEKKDEYLWETYGGVEDTPTSYKKTKSDRSRGKQKRAKKGTLRDKRKGGAMKALKENNNDMDRLVRRAPTEEEVVWCSNSRTSVVHGPMMVLTGTEVVQLLDGDVWINFSMWRTAVGTALCGLRMRNVSRDEMEWRDNW